MASAPMSSVCFEKTEQGEQQDRLCTANLGHLNQVCLNRTFACKIHSFHYFLIYLTDAFNAHAPQLLCFIHRFTILMKIALHVCQPLEGNLRPAVCSSVAEEEQRYTWRRNFQNKAQ